VWTIATAWAADAAFAAGERALGVEYLRTIAARYVAEDGLASECYRGDRPEPYNSCFLLGFSVAPFLSALFERLWGLRVDGVAGRLEVHPGFPDHWNSAELRGLHIMDGRVDLVWTPGRLTVRWTGSRPLTVDAGAAPRIVTPGEEASLELPTPSKM
jgi:glycogen debranching enzyme